MHTFPNRLNTLFAFTLTLLGVLTLGVFLSTVLEEYQGRVRIEANQPIVENVMDRSRNRTKYDLGDVQLDLDMNLQSLFNWNVRLLYVYLIAEYVSPSNSLNQVVLWNQTIKNGENTLISLQNIREKFDFLDDGEHLRSTNVTLSLEWNVVANAGRLQFKRANGSTSFVFPNQYAMNRLSTSKASLQQ